MGDKSQWIHLLEEAEYLLSNTVVEMPVLPKAKTKSWSRGKEDSHSHTKITKKNELTEIRKKSKALIKKVKWKKKHQKVALLTVLSCENLLKLSSFSEIVPYCISSIDNESYYRTKVKYSSSPLWNEEFEIGYSSKNSILTIEVWNDTSNRDDEYLGYVDVPLHSLEDNYAQNFTLPLKSKLKSGHGATISIKLISYPIDTKYGELIQFVDEDAFVRETLYDIIEENGFEAQGFAIVELLYSYGSPIPLLCYGIDKEISYVNQHKTTPKKVLIRKLLGAYCKFVRSSYLDEFLQPIITEIETSQISFEVRVSRIKNMNNLNANKKSLKTYAEKILKSIVTYSFDIPSEIRHLCRHIYENAKDISDEYLFEFMGDFFFQRFVCPGIATPSAFGLIRNNSSPVLMESLILLAKLIVNTGTNRLFSPGHELEFLNDFIIDKKDMVRKIYEQMAKEEKVGIYQILKSNKMKGEFRRYLEKSHSDELLSFIEDVKQYRQMNESDRKGFSHVIAKLYLEKDSERELNVDPLYYDKIKPHLSEASLDLFQEIKNITFDILRNDSYVKFVRESATHKKNNASTTDQLLTRKARKEASVIVHKLINENLNTLKLRAESSLEKKESIRKLIVLSSSFSSELITKGPSNILNNSTTWSKQPRLAWHVAAELLGVLIDIYRKFIAQGGLLTKVGISELKTTQSYLDFHSATSELSQVTVEYLSHNQKLAFWINTFNLMALHAHIEIGQPETPEEWYNFQHRACYQIQGQIYSMLQVEHCVLRAQLSLAKWIEFVGPGTQIKFSESDPRHKVILDKPEKLICFTLCNGALPTPIIRVYHPGMSFKEISKVVEDYLERTSVFNAQTKEVRDFFQFFNILFY